MTVDEVRAYVESLGGALTLAPAPGDGTPEIAWGDLFFYYAPDGEVPNTQPFATVVTKDYPDDASSQLDREGIFRVNVAAGAAEFDRWAVDVDPSTADTFIAHPVYGSMHWLSVVNPGAETNEQLRQLLARAHELARGRKERRES